MGVYWGDCMKLRRPLNKKYDLRIKLLSPMYITVERDVKSMLDQYRHHVGFDLLPDYQDYQFVIMFAHAKSDLREATKKIYKSFNAR